MNLPLGDEFPGKTVHRALRELHPPNGVQRLIGRALGTIDPAKILHLVVGRCIFSARERGWSSLTKLPRCPQPKRSCEAEAGLNDEAIPGRGSLICTGSARESIRTLEIP